MTDSVVALVGFGSALRSAGVPVDPDAVRTFCTAAALLEPEDLYWAGRATLLTCPDHIAVYDYTFGAYFNPKGEGETNRDDAEETVTRTMVTSLVAVGDAEHSGSPRGTASSVDLLAQKRFAEFTDEDWVQLIHLLAQLPTLLPLRRGRRYERGGPGPVAIRRLVRNAGRTGGEPFDLPRRRRRMRPRPLTFLLDISGSMTAHSRALLLFAHAVSRSGIATNVYAFGTRVTDLTETVALSNFGRVLEVSEQLVPDWDGGTRIGDAICTLIAARGHRGDSRRAIVVICSDGLDTGDPSYLGDQVERLNRASHRVVWLNPLKEDARYEPLARGMRAALPHVDAFGSCHDTASVLSALSDLDRKRHRRRPDPW